MRSVSQGFQLLKTVGLFDVRLNLAKLWLKNRKNKDYFWLKSVFLFFVIRTSVLAGIMEKKVRIRNVIALWDRNLNTYLLAFNRSVRKINFFFHF